MNAIEVIQQRRATKQFDAGYVMTLDEKRAAEYCAANAPSAFNLQHWRPLLIEDRAQREKIREAAWGQAQVTDASMLVVLCGDLSSWESQVKIFGQKPPSLCSNIWCLPWIATIVAKRRPNVTKLCAARVSLPKR